jgi:hypothetical protein
LKIAIALATPNMEAQCMNEISKTLAFWIFEAWRRLDSQLQTAHLNPAGCASGSSGWIRRTDETGGRVSMESSDRPMGQNKEWTIALNGAKFSFTPSSETITSV